MTATSKLITCTDLLENFFLLDGKPLSFAQFPFFYDIINSAKRHKLLMTARQVGKSTLLCSILSSNIPVYDKIRQLYISPSKDQTTVFSSTRLQPMILSSDLMTSYYYDRAHFNVLNMKFRSKVFGDGSEIRLRYSGVAGPDSTRGISTDKLLFDERQDLIKDDIDIIAQTAFRTAFPGRCDSGTPKRLNNPLSEDFKIGTMKYWIITCPGCNKHNCPDSLAHVSREGPICANCGKRIHVRDGRWVAFNDRKDPLQIDSFHISQLMIDEPNAWSNMYATISDPHLTEQTLYNEILGHPYDSYDVPITKQEIVACCNSELKNCLGKKAFIPRKLGPRVLCVDTGLGKGSLTVVGIMEILNDNKPCLLGMKKYKLPLEQDPRWYTKDIIQKAIQYQCDRVAIDWGNSQSDIPRIVSALRPNRIPVDIFMGADTPRRWYFNKTHGAYVHSRTLVLASVFGAMRNREISFFNAQEFEEFYVDILAEFIDYTISGPNRGKLFYNHNEPDDALFSLLYGFLCLEIMSFNSVRFGGN